MLKGKATMYTNSQKLGLGRAFFRKALVDLETMKVLAVDPARGTGKSVSEMIQMCKDLGQGDN